MWKSLGVASAWYFAYGSNMQSATFRGRRGIAYSRAVAARTAGWRLVFDKPPLISIGESFANVRPDAAASVLGVAYEIDDDDLARIDLTEGVLIGNYERVAISIEPIEGPRELLPAFTLTSTRSDPSLRPSTRYMALVIEGAIEHGLPAEHVEWLRSVPARSQSRAAALLRPLIDQAMKRR